MNMNVIYIYECPRMKARLLLATYQNETNLNDFFRVEQIHYKFIRTESKQTIYTKRNLGGYTLLKSALMLYHQTVVWKLYYYCFNSKNLLSIFHCERIGLVWRHRQLVTGTPYHCHLQKNRFHSHTRMHIYTYKFVFESNSCIFFLQVPIRAINKIENWKFFECSQSFPKYKNVSAKWYCSLPIWIDYIFIFNYG